jgi:hypothetical protein
MNVTKYVPLYEKTDSAGVTGTVIFGDDEQFDTEEAAKNAHASTIAMLFGAKPLAGKAHKLEFKTWSEKEGGGELVEQYPGTETPLGPMMVVGGMALEVSRAAIAKRNGATIH